MYSKESKGALSVSALKAQIEDIKKIQIDVGDIKTISLTQLDAKKTTILDKDKVLEQLDDIREKLNTLRKQCTILGANLTELSDLIESVERNINILAPDRPTP